MPSSMDGRLSDVFGAPVVDLYVMVASPDTSTALIRALELRSFLALAEEQVARVRNGVHRAMDPRRDMDELSASDLHMDAQWLEAALEARDGYLTALDRLLRTMPPPSERARPVRLAHPAVSTTLPLAAPAPQRAGAARAHRS
ncbi:hypothetical protein J7I94_02170 [Streptomyces sp. ISL-12]|uniref:hypothetical protein n=1 Tax=Streptomyces sp. ISL-12 TaxID=2819177 RepID=UPI001BEC6D76|nr:hypothetical protein [Streptomyces sp. ISL-12]MBT2409377.1 hypothetical protein [Streptomyces sp. ISL-12]